MSTTDPRGLQTLAVHAGEGPDPATRAFAPNLVMSTTFVIEPDIAFSAEELEPDAPFVYTRWGNPTVRRLEEKLAALEAAEACIAFASRMAAISALFTEVLRPGDHLIMSDVAYAGASEFVNSIVPRGGVAVSRVDLSDLDAVRAELRPETRLVYAEAPVSPILRLVDIAGLARVTHGAGAKLAVDSTFATPVATRPVELGADFVLHSLTKYIGGHGDAVGGALLGRDEDLLDIRRGAAIHMGGLLSPFNAWLILRGVATVPVRMRAHAEGAPAGVVCAARAQACARCDNACASGACGKRGSTPIVGVTAASRAAALRSTTLQARGGRPAIAQSRDDKGTWRAVRTRSRAIGGRHSPTAGSSRSSWTRAGAWWPSALASQMRLGRLPTRSSVTAVRRSCMPKTRLLRTARCTPCSWTPRSERPWCTPRRSAATCS